MGNSVAQVPAGTRGLSRTAESSYRDMRNLMDDTPSHCVGRGGQGLSKPDPHEISSNGTDFDAHQFPGVPMVKVQLNLRTSSQIRSRSNATGTLSYSPRGRMSARRLIFSPSFLMWAAASKAPRIAENSSNNRTFAQNSSVSPH